MFLFLLQYKGRNNFREFQIFFKDDQRMFLKIKVSTTPISSPFSQDEWYRATNNQSTAGI